MNDAERQSRFKEALQNLLEAFGRSNAPERAAVEPGDEGGPPLEHTTRIHLLDGILTALGWTLGPVGNVVEEARVVAETTTFIDYLGVSAIDQAPQLIVEAKAYDKPFVAPRRAGQQKPPGVLIIEAINHLKADGEKAKSPVIGLWHDYLGQVRGYVRDLHDQYGHSVSRVVLTSGKWMVVFHDPVGTFLSARDADPSQFALFFEDEYVERSTELLDLAGLAAVSEDIPKSIASGHIGIYIAPADIVACFHGLHLIYKDLGSSYLGAKPNIAVLPTLIFHRRDGAVLIVMDRGDPAPLPHEPADFQAHFDAVDAASTALKQRCEAILNCGLAPQPIEEFVGFPRRARPFARQINQAPQLVALQQRAGEYMLATGAARHFLSATPAVDPCRFHSWAQAHIMGAAVGAAAVNFRSMEPRSYFIDGEPLHCAHAGFEPVRDSTCHVAPIDRRICCQVCVYRPVCWPGQPQLPCGT